MSTGDFDAYLDLLSRFLRLNRQQREDIRRELRAHVEDALDDELARGVNRDEALRRVLDDFGDAAELAARFSALRRKRRWLMHGTIAAACIGFVVLAMNIGSHTQKPPAAGAPDTSEDQRIQQALASRVDEIAFEEAPLSQALDWQRHTMDINLHVQWDCLEREGVERDAPITVQLRNVTHERLLRLLLDEFPNADLDYEILDGILVISTKQSLRRHMTTEVYDVRDILELIEETERLQVRRMPRVPMAASHAVGGAAAPSAPADAAQPADTPNLLEGMFVPVHVPAAEIAEKELSDVLTQVIEPDTWVSNGGLGDLQILSGVLVVRQYEAVHADIRDFLSEFRRVALAQAD